MVRSTYSKFGIRRTELSNAFKQIFVKLKMEIILEML